MHLQHKFIERLLSGKNIRYILTLIIFLSLVILSGQIFSQERFFGGETNIKPFTLHGSAHVSGQFYNTNGIRNRRAPALGEGGIDLNFSVFGIRSGINLLYSSDNPKLRQNMNKFSFSGQWKFISLSVGTVSPTFSKYSLSGATITGGDIIINPGIFYLEITGGRSKRAVKPDSGLGFRGAAYAQQMYAAKIGLGNQDGSHFFLSAIYAKDDTNSIKNTNSIKPQANISLTPDLEIRLFNNRFALKGQVTVSAFTEDLRSKKIDVSNSGVPSFLTNIFTPQVSSRINYAGDLGVSLNLTNMSLQFGYIRIQPGFHSLGISDIRNDQQKYNAQTQFRIFNNKLNIGCNYSRSEDNLLGDRISTQQTSNYGINVNARITKRFNINSSYTLLVNDVNPTTVYSDTASTVIKSSQNAQTIMLQPTLSFQTGTEMHNISLTGTYISLSNHISGISGISNQNFDSKTYTSSLAYSLSFRSGLAINLVGNYLKSDAGNTSTSNTGGNLGVTYAFFNRKITSNFNFGLHRNFTERTTGGINVSTKMRQIIFNLNFSYRLTHSDNLTLSARRLDNSTIEGGGYSFIENEARLIFQHSF